MWVAIRVHIGLHGGRLAMGGCIGWSLFIKCFMKMGSLSCVSCLVFLDVDVVCVSTRRGRAMVEMACRMWPGSATGCVCSPRLVCQRETGARPGPMCQIIRPCRGSRVGVWVGARCDWGAVGHWRWRCQPRPRRVLGELAWPIAWGGDLRVGIWIWGFYRGWFPFSFFLETGGFLFERGDIFLSFLRFF